MSEQIQRSSLTYLIGAGVVGREVAAAHLEAGHAIRLIESSSERLSHAVEWLKSQFRTLSASGFEPWEASYQCALRLMDTPPPDPTARALVIESISENPAAKKLVLLQASRKLGRDTVLATNTSTLRITDIVDTDISAQHVVGLHFFMPVRQRFLIEVVRAGSTSDETLKTALDHVGRLNRRALVVNDNPGFVVNRMLSPYLNQSLHALCRGATPEHIERVALAAGMPMGPLELLDWIGMETSIHAGRAIWKAFPQRIEPTPLLPGMIKARLLGRMAGNGFFSYPDGLRSKSISQEAQKRIADYSRDPVLWSDELLRDWLFFPMLLEAAGILGDKTAANMEAIDVGLSGGLGFQRPGGFSSLWNGLSNEEIEKRLIALQQISMVYQTEASFTNALHQERSLRDAMQRIASSAQSTAGI